MAKRGGLIERNSFIKGLITEATPLTFPENASVLDENFELNRDGSRSRRLGLDFEGSYTANEIISATQITDDQINTFEWFDAGTTQNKNFIVVQIGSILHFFDIEESDVLSANKRDWTVDLADFALSNNTSSEVEVGFTCFGILRGMMFIWRFNRFEYLKKSFLYVSSF